MSSENILWLIEQKSPIKGKLNVDIKALNEYINEGEFEGLGLDGILEIYDEDEVSDGLVFKNNKGKLQIRNNWGSWGEYVTTYGFCVYSILEPLSKFIQDDTEFLFNEDPEGNPGSFYHVKKDSVNPINLKYLSCLS